MSDISFPRQPGPVTVRLEGAIEDKEVWFQSLVRFCEYKGDLVEIRGEFGFTIYPRAVND